MVVGTTSLAGKSLLVTALCRIYARRGVRVAPFKAQNMSNNAAVCADGAEIGRAQAVQAAAAGIEPTAQMNPLLLKPEAESRSQIVLLGRPLKTESARAYLARKQEFWSVVTASLDRLRREYELVVIEGAGSPVELNLKSRDIVNMAVARYAQAPVLLVGDIDRGGVFAQLLGTLWLLEPEERELVKGLVVNKFRGNMSLFFDGVRILEERGGVPVLGIVPYVRDLGIPEEDAVVLDEPLFDRSQDKDINIVVIKLPLISNFDDFDPLAAEPGVHVRYVSSTQELGRPDAVILPGTKSTIADLAWLRERGLAQRIVQLARENTPVVGICGGYQMLGQSIHDPDHVESSVGEIVGLGLLPIHTTFEDKKSTHRDEAVVLDAPGWLGALNGEAIYGYEIHMGQTSTASPWLEITQRNGQHVCVRDGTATSDGRIWGCYLHGIFENERLRRTWLSELGWLDNDQCAPSLERYEAAFERLANVVEDALDVQKLDAIVGFGQGRVAHTGRRTAGLPHLA
jgi:adenosylcobyric acid synthase